MNVDKVLVPLDGSLMSEAALPKAVEQVQHNPRAMLILLRAVGASTLPGIDASSIRVAAIVEAAEYLKAVAARLRTDGVPRVMTSVRYGVRTAAAIVDAAHSAKADLIVMSDGRGGGQLISGPVAAAVRRGTRTPILLGRVDDVPAEAPRGARPPVSGRRPMHERALI